MKRIILWLFKVFIFWLLLFYFLQIVFIAYNSAWFNEVTLNEVLRSMAYAFFMDVSTASYLMLLPCILLIAGLNLKNNKKLIPAINIVVIIQGILCVITGIVDAGLYSAWGTRLNSKAFSYIFYPGELFKGITSVSLPLLVLLLFIIAGTLYLVLRKWVNLRDIPAIRTYKIILLAITLFPLLFLGLRGGVQARPIGKGWVYHSNNPLMNNASLNGFWNLMEIFINQKNEINPYQFFPDSYARKVVRDMYNDESDSTTLIINNRKPNIVLILMESVSADNLESLGGLKGIMPGLDSVSRHGLTFTDFYASGFRTEQGLIALLSGFPAQPAGTIIRQFGKFENLPLLGKILVKNGYSNNYYYSGDLSYANTKSYLLNSGFSKIIGEEQEWKRKTKWGAYDEELFNFHIKNVKYDKQPFFSIIMTSTNHEPFDGEVERVFKEDNTESAYKNTSYYTDKCLIKYLKSVAREPWYSNTLFIITSDHAHTYPKHRAYNEPGRHHVPFVLFGDVLKPEYRGKKVNKTTSQTDFPAILLSQLNINYSVFKWSKNPFNNKSPEFAFYSFDNGFGLIAPDRIVVYDHNFGKILTDMKRKDSVSFNNLPEQGKAFLQTLLDDVIKLGN